MMPDNELYSHMEGDPDQEIDIVGAMPMTVSPRFSLAYLRQNHDPVVLLTTAGRVTFLNDAAGVFLGLPDIAGAQGRDLWEFWDTAEAEALREPLLDAGTGLPQSVPASCPVSDDRIKRHQMTAAPVVDGEGRIESVFVVFSDPD